MKSGSLGLIFILLWHLTLNPLFSLYVCFYTLPSFLSISLKNNLNTKGGKKIHKGVIIFTLVPYKRGSL
jgi:hypothetical protein